jgi:hypothetical protein
MFRSYMAEPALAVAFALVCGCADAVPESPAPDGDQGADLAQVADSAAAPDASATTPVIEGTPPRVEPNAPSASTVTGASTTPLTYDDDPDVKCYNFRAYGSPEDKTQPYSVPTTPDLYTSFTFKAPWTGTMYLKSARSLLDNLPVIHHWMLLRQHNDGPEKITPNASGIHGDGDILHSWAPGATDMYLGADVGMELPGGTLLMLENHYYNRTGAPSPDRSGAEICVTPKKPKNLAGLSYVGTDMINGTSATGTCTHQSKEPVHIIMTFPHMHKKGVHMKVDWTHADGTKTVLHDKPFSFEYQRSYVHDTVLQPGDKLTTTCTYDAPARMGKGTDQEMCFYFSLHWPAGQLARKNFYQALHGPNTCID